MQQEQLLATQKQQLHAAHTHLPLANQQDASSYERTKALIDTYDPDARRERAAQQAALAKQAKALAAAPRRPLQGECGAAEGAAGSCLRSSAAGKSMLLPCT